MSTLGERLLGSRLVYPAGPLCAVRGEGSFVVRVWCCVARLTADDGW